MSDAKFTPGPWKTQSAGVGFRRPTERSGDLAIVGSTGICPGIIWMADGGEREGSYEEMRANAHLIAAAPELYEALQVCQSAMQTMLSPGAIHSTTAQHAFALLVDAEFRARSAIAKADGR